MLASAFENRSHHAFVLHVPRVSAGERVAQMPTEGCNAAVAVMIPYLFSDAPERNAVEIATVAQLNAAEVETEHCRIVVAYALYVRACAVALPADAVDSVVVMSEHICRVGKACKVLKQILGALRATAIGHRVVGFLVARAR